MSSDVSSHQLVGYVTKMYPTFGYINNEIFFQRKCVIGPMVEVGDNVAASAVYQPHMPIKWSAEKVWRVEERHGRPREKSEMNSYWRSQSPSDHSASRDARSRHPSHERDLHLSVTPQRRGDEKKGSHSTLDRDLDRSLQTSPSREVDKRRRSSPASNMSAQQSSPSDGHYKSNFGSKYMLNVKELLQFDLHRRFPSIFPPVDLYRVRCHWQDSFPLLKPFQPHKATVFQILGRAEDTSNDSNSDCKTDDSFIANVILLSLPALTDLMEKIVVRAESSNRMRGSLRKYIRILAAGRANDRFKAVGGPWSPEVDGPDPVTNPQTLINTAIRSCKEQIGLDLSRCSQWHRFLEFRYSRTEGSTAQPTSVLFPGSQLWGRTYAEPASADPIPPTKPFHQIVVYFLPNIWSLMPSEEEWPTIKSAYEIALSSKEPCTFPLSPSELNKYTTTESDYRNKKQKGKDSVSSIQQSEQSSPSGNSPVFKSDSEFKSNEESISVPALDSICEQESAFKSPEIDDGSDQLDAKSQKGISEQEIGEKCQKKLYNELNLSSMKVSELREQLKARDLPTDGVKAQLLSRLKSAIEDEVESAKQAEKEKELQEKFAQESITLKSTPSADNQASQPSEVKFEMKPKVEAPRISLRDFPCIIVQRKRAVDFHLQSVGLDVILNSKIDFMDARAYEFIFCVHTIFDMLRRDAIFTLFRALITAGDRGICAKPRKRSKPDYSSKRARVDQRDKSSGLKDEEPKEVPLHTTDLSLLFACTILDTGCRSYFLSSEVEDFIISLGLPISRYQLRSLVYKVTDHNRLHYRSLTDSEEPLSLSNKSSVIFSDIDDDEYLLELVRGGDAILDEQSDSAIPNGTILVLEQNDYLDGSKLVPATQSAEDFFQHLRFSEREQSRLLTQIRLQEQEIGRLRSSVVELSVIKDKLAKVSSGFEDYRRRYRDERNKVDSLVIIIDQQASVLDACRSALRQASSRMHSRHSLIDISKPSSKRSSHCSSLDIKESPKSTPKKIKLSDSETTLKTDKLTIDISSETHQTNQILGTVDNSDSNQHQILPDSGSQVVNTEKELVNGIQSDEENPYETVKSNIPTSDVISPLLLEAPTQVL